MQTLLDRVINSTNKALKETELHFDFSVALSNKAQPEIQILLKETNKDLQFEINPEYRVTRPITLNHQMHILRVVPTYNLVKQNKKLIETLTEIIALNLED